MCIDVQMIVILLFRSTVVTFGLFLDAFQRIADLATNTKGATRDIGTALTRLILRHKAIEHKLKSFTSSLVETFVLPLNERIEEWKKSANTLDKDHARGLKGIETDTRNQQLINFCLSLREPRLQKITQWTT